MNQTRTVNLRDLALWPDNYNEGDVGAIMISILTYGFNTVPRIWIDPENPETQIVMANNHAVKALWELRGQGAQILSRYELRDHPWPPIHVSEDEEGEWFIDVLEVSHLPYDEAEAYAIADNEIARRSSKDIAKLTKLLTSIQEKNPKAFRATGIDSDRLSDLLKLINPPSLDELADKYGEEPTETDFYKTIRILVPKETEERYNSLMDQIQGKNPAEKFRILLDAVDLAAIEFQEEEGDLS